MKAFTRPERVAGLIQKTLSNLLRHQINDPRLDTAIITAVKMTRDLKSARIYYVVSGGSIQKQAAAEGFKRAHGYVKRTLAHELDLRYMPELSFYYDESLDYGLKIDAILKSIKSREENATDY
jgi:ribosome-binding factor A